VSEIIRVSRARKGQQRGEGSARKRRTNRKGKGQQEGKHIEHQLQGGGGQLGISLF